MRNKKLKLTFIHFFLYLLLWTSSIGLAGDGDSDPGDDSLAPKTLAPSSIHAELVNRVSEALKVPGQDYDEFRFIHTRLIQDDLDVTYSDSRAASESLSPSLTYHLTPSGELEFRHPNLHNTVLRYTDIQAFNLSETEEFVFVFVKQTDLAQKLIHGKAADADDLLGFYWFKKSDANRIPLSPIALHFYKFPEGVSLNETLFGKSYVSEIAPDVHPQTLQVSIRRIFKVDGGTDQEIYGRFTLDRSAMAIQYFTDQITLLGLALAHRHDLGNLDKLRTLIHNIQSTAEIIDHKLNSTPTDAATHQKLTQIRSSMSELKNRMTPDQLFGAKAISQTTHFPFHDPGPSTQIFHVLANLKNVLDRALLTDTLESFASLDLDGSLQHILLDNKVSVAQEAIRALNHWKKSRYVVESNVGLIATLSLGATLAFTQIALPFMTHWDGIISHSLGANGFWIAMGKLCFTNVAVLGVVMAIGAGMGLSMRLPLMRRTFPTLHFIRPVEAKNREFGTFQSFELNGTRLYQYINYWLASVWKHVVPAGIQERLKIGLARALPEDFKFAQDLQTTSGDEPLSRTIIRQKRQELEVAFGEDAVKIMAFHQMLIEEDIKIRDQNRPRILLMLEAYMNSEQHLTPQTDELFKIYQYLCIRTMALEGHGFQDGFTQSDKQKVYFKSLFKKSKQYAEQTSKPLKLMVGSLFQPTLGKLTKPGSLLVVTTAVASEWIPRVMAQIATNGWGNPHEPLFSSESGLNLVLPFDIFQWMVGFFISFSLFGIYANDQDFSRPHTSTGVLSRFSTLLNRKFMDHGKQNVSTTFINAYKAFLAVLPLRVLALSAAMGTSHMLTQPLTLNHFFHYLLIVTPLLTLAHYVLFDSAIKSIKGTVPWFKKIALISVTGFMYGTFSHAIMSWTQMINFFQHTDIVLLGGGILAALTLLKVRKQEQEIKNIYLNSKCD
jgi:hypothetical protein